MCYTGFRVGNGWGGRTLPRSGVVHVSSLSAHLPGWLHVQPYKDSVNHAISDLCNGEVVQLQLAQVRQSEGDGLGSDGPYGMATSCLAAVVCAITALSNPKAIPECLKQSLGAIRCSSVPPAKTAVARMVQCILADHWATGFGCCSWVIYHAVNTIA